jgi:hypothetical protein
LLVLTGNGSTAPVSPQVTFAGLVACALPATLASAPTRVTV